MDKQAVVARIFKSIDQQQVGLGGARDGLAFMGQPQTIRSQANNAVRLWLHNNDPSEIIGFVRLLQTVGIIDASVADDLSTAIDDITNKGDN